MSGSTRTPPYVTPIAPADLRSPAKAARSNCFIGIVNQREHQAEATGTALIAAVTMTLAACGSDEAAAGDAAGELCACLDLGGPVHVIGGGSCHR